MAKVALCARQLLINLSLPSFERRKIHVESIFLEAIDGGHVRACILDNISQCLFEYLISGTRVV
jgi:hypothetical protein